MTDLPVIQRPALPDWPRLMSVDLAARYLGIGQTSLRDHGPQPKRLGARVLYDRKDLDRWADALDGQPLDAAQRAAEGNTLLDRVRVRIDGK
jgi:hypothetical protein